MDLDKHLESLRDSQREGDLAKQRESAGGQCEVRFILDGDDGTDEHRRAIVYVTEGSFRFRRGGAPIRVYRSDSNGFVRAWLLRLWRFDRPTTEVFKGMEAYIRTNLELRCGDVVEQGAE